MRPPRRRTVQGKVPRTTACSGPDGNGDGQFEAEPPPESVRHVVNAANQVERVVLGPTVTNIDLLYDQAGNIVFDGVYYLQYDALNRLVQVNP